MYFFIEENSDRLLPWGLALFFERIFYFFGELFHVFKHGINICLKGARDKHHADASSFIFLHVLYRIRNTIVHVDRQRKVSKAFSRFSTQITKDLSLLANFFWSFPHRMP